MTAKNVCIVFEPATDEHISKDVIQVPTVISRLLGDSTPYLITRPNALQHKLFESINVIHHGEEIHGNNIALKNGTFEDLKINPDWYSSACQIAAEHSNFLMLYPFFGDYISGAWRFFLANMLRGRRSFVYLKLDASSSVLATYPKRKNGLKGKLRAIENLIKHIPISLISAESEETFTLYKQIFPELLHKTLVVKNCPSELEVSSLPSRTEIASQKKRYALAVGRFNAPEKAFDVLMTAWLHSAPQCQGWTLNLVGEYSDELYQYWRKELENHNILDTVNWIGSIKERSKIWNLFCEASLFIHPSRAEGAAIAITEALVAGCSLIVTPVGDVPTFLSADDPGVVPVNDVQKLSETIILFANNQNICQKQVDKLEDEFRKRKWSSQLSPVVKKFFDCSIHSKN